MGTFFTIVIIICLCSDILLLFFFDELIRFEDKLICNNNNVSFQQFCRSCKPCSMGSDEVGTALGRVVSAPPTLQRPYAAHALLIAAPSSNCSTKPLHYARAAS